MVAGMLASSGKTPLFVSQQTTKYFKFSDSGHSWVSSFEYSNVQSENCETGFFSLLVVSVVSSYFLAEIV